MKSANAFRTISEVATDLNVPQHVLRFWETKFPQIRPLKRGGGRRYYRPEDVELLRRIQALLYEERYTIKGAQRALREGRLVGPPLASGTATPDDVALDSGAEPTARDAAGEGGAAESTLCESDTADDDADPPDALAADEPPGLPSDLRHDLMIVLDELKSLRGALARLAGRDEKKSENP
ncbi:MerR family transcriptional regulator [Azospirillum griseum]|uniref:MerR family transcriptional regulator n=1 Tax=Azospirillum griseum TaxID=2496639 RepID=A0A431VN84_9PROT|nr:MerR family transcriptional regulator [Azospirillum griseum]RTR24226.1 MerR family transcriptional regulator [Azospirillum griseum]